MVSDVLFLPVKPTWADAIVRGDKTLELRKRLPTRGAGRPCLVYATSPMKRVVGTCTFVAGRSFKLDAASAELPRTVVDRRQFEAYFDDRFFARFEDAFDARWFGLDLADHARFERPVPLAVLRQRWRIEPPQQWSYVSSDVLREIVAFGSGST